VSKIAKLVGVVVAALLALSLAAATSSARVRVEVSTTATLISGRLTFAELPDSGFIPNIICEVTLHATLNRLIAKVRLTQAGGITAILTANCRNSFGGGATATPLAGMLVFYDSIRGTLPTITGGLLWTTSRFLVETSVLGSEIRCLYAGLVGAESTANPVTSQTILPNEIPLFEEHRGTRRCPERGQLRGTLRVSPEVTIRLLEVR